MEDVATSADDEPGAWVFAGSMFGAPPVLDRLLGGQDRVIGS